MKIAVLTIAYNESQWIGACIKQFKEFGFHHLVLVSALPWNGEPVEDDGTANNARNSGAETIVQYWVSEAEQRNWGLARLYDYDYVLIVDADELYTNADISRIKNTLYNEACYRVSKMVTYWKTPKYVFDPPDKHKPIIAVNPKVIKFSEHRMVRHVNEKPMWQLQPFIDVTLHHMSWVKSDKKVEEKIQSFSHADQIRSEWYEKVWKEWLPGSQMLIRPYGHEKSRAKHQEAPEEIKRYAY